MPAPWPTSFQTWESSLFGIECDVESGLERGGTSRFEASVFGTWAAVTPREISQVTVLAMGLSAVVPNPLQADSLLLTARTVGWLACPIPRPQDFSMFWHL